MVEILRTGILCPKTHHPQCNFIGFDRESVSVFPRENADGGRSPLFAFLKTPGHTCSRVQISSQLGSPPREKPTRAASWGKGKCLWGSSKVRMHFRAHNQTDPDPSPGSLGPARVPNSPSQNARCQTATRTSASPFSSEIPLVFLLPPRRPRIWGTARHHENA